MKNTMIYSLLLIIISAGSLSAQNDVDAKTTRNQIIENQDKQHQIAPADKGPEIVVHKTYKKSYQSKKTNRSRRQSCCSAHAPGAHQRTFAEYQKRRSAKKRQQSKSFVKNNTSNNQ